MNDKYLNNGYFYLTCNSCERLIKSSEMSKNEYNRNGGYCPEHAKEHLKILSSKKKFIE